MPRDNLNNRQRGHGRPLKPQVLQPPLESAFRGLHHAFRLLGSSQITPLKVSDSSSLLTSLRTVSGFHWFRVFRRHYDVFERHYLCHVGAGQGQAVSGKLRTIVA